MADSRVATLEVLNDVTVQLVESMEPWTLDIDALVVAVGPDGFGGLGQAMSRHLPHAFPDDIAFNTVTPENPLWLDLEGPSLASSAPPLSSVILATAHDARGRKTVSRSSLPTIGAAATGLLNAVLLADEHGVARLGVTFLGTGLLGLDAGDVAAAAALRVRELVTLVGVRRLRRLVLIAGDRPAYLAIAAVWRSFAPTTFSTLDVLTRLLETRLPQTSLSDTAGAVLARALENRLPARLFPESDGRLVGEAVLLEASKYQDRWKQSDVVAAWAGEIAATGDTNPTDLSRRLSAELELTVRHDPSQSGRDVADALPLMELAAEFAERTVGRPEVHQRHLLAAALLARPLISPVLDALGVDEAGLRRCLRTAIAKVVPDEAPAEWDHILSGTDAIVTPSGDDGPTTEEYSDSVLAGGYLTDLVNPEEKIPADRDLLGINTYVSMLASVIANKDTPLPLSIGLFGEWGSGKSFFMGRLRQQIDELSSQDGYLARIEQIGFNAWHYADTNLWASLGDEIFRQLAGPQSDDENSEAAKRRSQLVHDLRENLSQQQELEAATANAQYQVTELRAKLNETRKRQGEAVSVLLTSLAKSSTLKKQLSRAWSHLGVDDQVEQGELLARQIRGLNDDVGVLRRATDGWRGIGVAVLIALSLLLLGTATLVPHTVRDWLIRGGLSGVAAALAVLSAMVGRVAAGARLLAKVATEVQDEKNTTVTKKTQEQVAALKRAQADADILTTQLAEVRARAGEIGRQLAELAPGQRFYGFVADRAASQDYQGKLGLISTIRRDFERLIKLMQDWRDHPEDHANQQPIDRIVLYIDDLDRCSPDQVVEVLQAVHLLLALDLFVVVVGVDPRWLLHSLEQRYRDNFAFDVAAPDRVDTGQPSGWDATALNYLEKIFNIPFVLPGMTTHSFAELISGWSQGSAATSAQQEVGKIESPGEDVHALPDTAAPVADAQQAGSTPATTDESSATTAVSQSPAAVGVAADVPVEAGSAVDQISRGQRLAPRPLSPQEIAHLRALAPLVQTPREAKRVFNLYRTLRASGNLSPASAFLGDEEVAGEFQAVIVLLGLLTAEPSLVGDLLFTPSDGICHRSPGISWSGLLDQLEPRQNVAALSDWSNALGTLKTDTQRELWERVLPKLRQASEPVTLPDLIAFQKWGPLVARFSFILSPLAAGAADGSAVAQRPPPST